MLRCGWCSPRNSRTPWPTAAPRAAPLWLPSDRCGGAAPIRGTARPTAARPCLRPPLPPSPLARRPPLRSPPPLPSPAAPHWPLELVNRSAAHPRPPEPRRPRHRAPPGINHARGHARWRRRSRPAAGRPLPTRSPEARRNLLPRQTNRLPPASAASRASKPWQPEILLVPELLRRLAHLARLPVQAPGSVQEPPLIRPASGNSCCATRTSMPEACRARASGTRTYANGSWWWGNSKAGVERRSRAYSTTASVQGQTQHSSLVTASRSDSDRCRVGGRLPGIVASASGRRAPA